MKTIIIIVMIFFTVQTIASAQSCRKVYNHGRYRGGNVGIGRGGIFGSYGLQLPTVVVINIGNKINTPEPTQQVYYENKSYQKVVYDENEDVQQGYAQNNVVYVRPLQSRGAILAPGKFVYKDDAYKVKVKIKRRY